MRYRAILRGVEPAAKPQQSFGESLGEVQRWATATLATVDAKWKPTACVVVDEQVWQWTETIR